MKGERGFRYMAGEWFQHLVLSRKRTGSFALYIVLRSFHIIKDMCMALPSFCRKCMVRYKAACVFEGINISIYPDNGSTRWSRIMFDVKSSFTLLSIFYRSSF